MTGLGLEWCREDATHSRPGHQLGSVMQRDMFCIVPGSEQLHLKNDSIFRWIKSGRKERDSFRIYESFFLSFAWNGLCLSCLRWAQASVVRWSAGLLSPLCELQHQPPFPGAWSSLRCISVIALTETICLHLCSST